MPFPGFASLDPGYDCWRAWRCLLLGIRADDLAPRFHGWCGGCGAAVAAAEAARAQRAAISRKQRDRCRAVGDRIVFLRQAILGSGARDIVHDPRERAHHLSRDLGAAVTRLHARAVADAVPRQAADERCAACGELSARRGDGLDHTPPAR